MEKGAKCSSILFDFVGDTVQFREYKVTISRGQAEKVFLECNEQLISINDTLFLVSVGNKDYSYSFENLQASIMKELQIKINFKKNLSWEKVKFTSVNEGVNGELIISYTCIDESNCKFKSLH